MSQLKIFKASAGSGKTFRLVLEYIKLLVENPYNFRHILAVTFTNKATAEMKERIIRDLYAVAREKDEKFIKMLVLETNINREKVIENAGIALSGILHNYDRFAVSTIDSFFQRVLRSFARESGLYGAYEVELDSDDILQEACDRLLLSVEDDVELRKWILDMSEDMLTQGKNWQVRTQIIELGKELFKDDCQDFIRTQGSLESERQKLKSLKTEIFKTKNFYENSCRELGNKAIEILDRCNATLNDFSYKSSSFANYFFKLSACKGGLLEPGKRYHDALDRVDLWAGKNGNKVLMETLYNEGLNDVMHQIINFQKKHTPNYITALEISKYIYTLGVLSTLLVKIREIGKEENTLLLNEGNMLLHGIIGDNDAPFIYEKTGSYYKYFMIDEFQDTSVTQWENFRPLVVNSLSENNPCLVVGDVKQSIYRWRNGDWQLLDHELKEQLNRFKIDEITLESNWRSSENIVNFNNSFFVSASQAIQQFFNNELPEDKDYSTQYRSTITDAFADVEQNVASGKKGGFVQCTFIDDEDYRENTLQKVIEAVESIQKNGARAKDIAILVYKNAHGKEIAEALLNHKKNNSQYNFEIISDDSLFIESSPAVRLLIGLMQYIISPADKVLQAELVHEYSRKILPVLAEQGKIPPRFVLENMQQQIFDESSTAESFFSKRVKIDYFPFFENEAFRFIIHKWGNRSIADLTEELICEYHLDYLPGEQATIQAFKDVVSDFSKKDGGNLHKFIEWWESFGSKIKVQSAGERDAIRIMTLHKAKGLEFPYVLVPFCDEKFESSGNNAKILWCKTDNTAYRQFPLVPVKSTKALMSSLFHREYYTEKLMSYIDSLNKLYVAFTRAEKGLFIYTRKVEKFSASGDSLLTEILQNGEKNKNIPVETGDSIYALGELEHIKSENFISNETVLSVRANRKTAAVDTLRLRANYDGFIDESEKSYLLKVNEGKIMHELLSEIVTIDDINKAIKVMLNAGKVDTERAETLLPNVEKLLANQQAKDWFSGKYKVMNETTILSSKHGMLRPDRIMVEGTKKAIIVDYKTTSIVSKAHKKQVAEYAMLLKQMGFNEVEAYVWYLNNNTIKSLHEKFE